MCLCVSIAESITALLAGMHPNLQRVYQNQNQRNLPVCRKRLWGEFYERWFYEVNIKKAIYEIEHQDIYLDKAVYENQKVVKAERMNVYKDTDSIQEIP